MNESQQEILTDEALELLTLIRPTGKQRCEDILMIHQTCSDIDQYRTALMDAYNGDQPQIQRLTRGTGLQFLHACIEGVPQKRKDTMKKSASYVSLYYNAPTFHSFLKINS